MEYSSFKNNFRVYNKALHPDSMDKKNVPFSIGEDRYILDCINSKPKNDPSAAKDAAEHLNRSLASVRFRICTVLKKLTD